MKSLAVPPGRYETESENVGVTHARSIYLYDCRRVPYCISIRWASQQTSEIGIYSGGSLLLWKEYFGKNAKIYGVDIHEACRAFADQRTKIFIGDQADRSFWAEVK